MRFPFGREVKPYQVPRVRETMRRQTFLDRRILVNFEEDLTKVNIRRSGLRQVKMGVGSLRRQAPWCSDSRCDKGVSLIG